MFCCSRSPSEAVAVAAVDETASGTPGNWSRPVRHSAQRPRATWPMLGPQSRLPASLLLVARDTPTREGPVASTSRLQQQLPVGLQGSGRSYTQSHPPCSSRPFRDAVEQFLYQTSGDRLTGPTWTEKPADNDAIPRTGRPLLLSVNQRATAAGHMPEALTGLDLQPSGQQEPKSSQRAPGLGLRLPRRQARRGSNPMILHMHWSSCWEWRT